MSFLRQFRRRRLTQWVLAYLAGAWLFLESFGFIAESFDWPQFIVRGIIVLLLAGLLAVITLAWFHGERGRQQVTITEGLMLGGLAIAAGTVLLALAPAEIQEQCAVLNVDASADRSIAVLPFEHRSHDGRHAYVTDGIHSEIVTHLGKISGLRVISRTSVMHYRDTRRDLPSIGRELDTRYLVEGGAQVSDDRIHIVSRLVDGLSDEVIWTESYDRDLTAESVFDIQHEVATSIALALDVNLSPEEYDSLTSGDTDSLEALSLFLRGKQLQNSFTGEALEESIGLFRRAIEADPDFAAAHAALGEAYIWRGHGFANVAPRDLYPLARAAVERALELDPASADARITLGHLVWEVDLDPPSAESHLRSAVELNPSSAEARNVLGWFLLSMERYQESKETFADAYSLDPLSPRMCRDRASPYRVDGHHEHAISIYQECLRRHPDDWLTYLRLGRTYSNQGHEQAVVTLETALALNPKSIRARASLGHAYAVAGREAEARRLLDGVYAEADDGYVWPLAPAMIHAGLGETHEALEWLERARSQRITQLVWLRTNYPELRSLADDPGYLSIVGWAHRTQTPHDALRAAGFGEH
jgi:TolB-like protein/cytochrome c-type biogenesis protein CcmH/NrfG